MNQTTWAGVLAGAAVPAPPAVVGFSQPVAGLLNDLRGLDPAKAKEFVRAILPVLEMVAASTPNPFDNIAVALLARWANS